MDKIQVETEHGTRDVILPTPIGWKVLIRPKQAAKQSKGGIVLAEETTKAEDSMTYVGQILSLGDAAFTATTQGGIKMSHMLRPKVGDWVVYAPFAGQKMRVRGDDSLLLLLNDTEIQAIIATPDDYYATIDV